jgi:DUF1009 family protein
MKKASSNSPAPLGIIAGSGVFPLLVARAARRLGHRVAAMAIKGQTAPELAAEVDEIVWLRLGQLGGLIKGLKRTGVQRVVMCGPVDKTGIFSVRPDLRALKELKRLTHKGDDALLRGLCQVLAEEGVEVVPTQVLLPELLARPGVYTKREPDQREKVDAELGWRVAGELGRLDVGQCAVVKDGVVVALEAVEGTDRAIERGGSLAGPGAVVVKRCKPQQDTRFDLPTVGLTTVRTMVAARASCLIVEAGRGLVFDERAMTELADRKNICIAGWTGPVAGDTGVTER